jgi:hypothetical protein
VFTVALWFKGESGGKLIGFEQNQRGRSQNHDRHLYMGDDGRLHFGIWTGRFQFVSTPTPTSYNDGQWHHAAGTLSANGLRLFIDGDLIAQDPAAVAAVPYQGYWRVGNGTIARWPEAPASGSFTGTLDEIRIYDRALGRAAIRALYAYDPTEPTTTPRAEVEASIATQLQLWSQRGKFEKIEDYEARVNDGTRAIVRDSLTAQVLEQVGEDRIDWSTARNTYDPDAEVFTIRVDALEPFGLAVPIAEAEAFDANFRGLQYLNPVYGLGDGDDLTVEYVEVTDPASGRTYVYERP